MKINNTKSVPFTKSDVELCLLWEFKLRDPQTLFGIKETNPERYFEIVDTVFLKFTNHWIDKQTGELVTEDPKNPIMLYFVFGYPGYHTIQNIDDLIAHMNNAHILRAEQTIILN